MTTAQTAPAQMPADAGSTMSLWERVHITDPAFTRSFTTSSGFSGTSIAPLYLARKATEAFGPMGLGWGIELIEERYLEGAPIAYGNDGQVQVRQMVHTARFELWYVLNGQRGSIKHSGSTTVVGLREGKIFTNEDAAKMTQTDAMAKCLSMLGFGADVHLGLFDDVRYVTGLESAIAAGQLAGVNLQPVTPQAAGTSTASPAPVPAQLSKRYQAWRARIDAKAMDTEEERATARRIIQQDQGLSETERAMLLSLPSLSTSPTADPSAG